MPRALIAPTTSATIVEVPLAANYPNIITPLPVTISVFGLGASENIGLEVGNGSGEWIPLKQNSVITVLNNDNNAVSFYAPIFLRVNKPTTVAQVGVYLSSAAQV